MPPDLRTTMTQSVAKPSYFDALSTGHLYMALLLAHCLLLGLLEDVSVGLSTIVYGKPIQKNGMPKCMGKITRSKHAHAQSQFCEFETKVPL